MRRRDYLTALSLVGSAHLSGCIEDRHEITATQVGSCDSADSDIVIDRRDRWAIGKHDGTRVSKQGNLILDDIVVTEDNFTWSDPEESEFNWELFPQSSFIQTHPQEGYITLNPKDNIVELRQGRSAYALSEHSDWRMNIIQKNRQKTVRSAWEFWFKIDKLGHDPWILIDGGGGTGATTASSDDSCGSGFYRRRDQILTRYNNNEFMTNRFTDNPIEYLQKFLHPRGGIAGTNYHCWDVFRDAPIDYSSKTHMSLELLGSQGKANAYIDGKWQADLDGMNNQYVPSGNDMRVKVRLHHKSKQPETGYLYYMDIQKVGKKKQQGMFLDTVDAGKKVTWKDVSVCGSRPSDTEYKLRYSTDGNKWYTSLSRLPKCRKLFYKIKMNTDNQDITQVISEISFRY
jgi:hypothetical protein